ncbi:MAG: hypothetical protein K2P57_09950 [Burkholderiales bacterium]|nr:hypothetical protein [Burkholderiales bacterium]
MATGKKRQNPPDSKPRLHFTNGRFVPIADGRLLALTGLKVEVFQIHGVDERGKVAVRKQLKRKDMAKYFANLDRARLWCMQAHYKCASGVNAIFAYVVTQDKQ